MGIGPEIIDLIQRGSRQAMAPVLDRLEEKDALLGDHLARVMQDNLHRQVVAAVPNWAEINASPVWLNWLQGVDGLNGVTRQQLLNQAVQEGRASSVIALFRDFQKAAAGQPAQPGQPASILPSSYPVRSTGRIYSRHQILQMAARRRRGEFTDQQWLQWEHELIRAGNEGRIRGALDADGCQMGPR
jgi:hypothetical protein